MGIIGKGWENSTEATIITLDDMGFWPQGLEEPKHLPAGGIRNVKESEEETLIQSL